MTKTIYNSYINLLLENSNVEEVLNTLDIEAIDDHDVKVICRTIKYSAQALRERLSEAARKQI